MLNAIKVKKMEVPGVYSDRDGLFLNISKAGTKSWVYRYQLNKRRREMGLGSVKDYSLGEARALAAGARKLAKAGVDPIEARAEAAAADKVKPVIHTFQECADTYIANKEVDWSNAKHAQQWRNTLRNYAGPVIGDMDVAKVDVNHIEEILQPIWGEKNETASRVRGRIEKVLGWAKAKDYRDKNIANPAAWRDNLDVLLSKRHKAKHHPALHYTKVPELMAILSAKDTVGSSALQLAILCASRTGEIMYMEWQHVDLDAAVWTVPAELMKLKMEHRVPLNAPAVALLKSLEVRSHLVFPGHKHKRPISNNTMRKLLLGIHPGFTVHGMRSSFRDWCAEQTNFPDIVAEKSLAHGEKKLTVAAYRRTDLLAKRRPLMDAWGSYVTEANNNVVTLPVKRKGAVS